MSNPDSLGVCSLLFGNSPNTVLRSRPAMGVSSGRCSRPFFCRDKCPSRAAPWFTSNTHRLGQRYFVPLLVPLLIPRGRRCKRRSLCVSPCRKTERWKAGRVLWPSSSPTGAIGFCFLLSSVQPALYGFCAGLSGDLRMCSPSACV